MPRKLYEHQLTPRQQEVFFAFYNQDKENAKLVENFTAEYQKVTGQVFSKDVLFIMLAYYCPMKMSTEEKFHRIRNILSGYLFVLLLYKHLQEQPIEVYGEVLDSLKLNATEWGNGGLPKITFITSKTELQVSFSFSCWSIESILTDTIFNTALFCIIFCADLDEPGKNYTIPFKKFTRNKLISVITISYTKEELIMEGYQC